MRRLVPLDPGNRLSDGAGVFRHRQVDDVDRRGCERCDVGVEFRGAKCIDPDNDDLAGIRRKAAQERGEMGAGLRLLVGSHRVFEVERQRIRRGSECLFEKFRARGRDEQLAAHQRRGMRRTSRLVAHRLLRHNAMSPRYSQSI